MKYFIFFFVYISSIFCQEVKVSDIICDKFTVDNFTGDVYQEDVNSNIVWVKPPNSSTLKESRFNCLPSFASKKHLSVHYDFIEKKVLLYDFDKDTSYWLKKLGSYENSSPYLNLSPNGVFLLCENKIYNIIEDSIYQFNTNNLKYFNKVNNSDERIEWGNDNCIFFIRGEILYKQNLVTNYLEELVNLGNNERLTCYSFNQIDSAVYYGTYTSNNTTKIYIHFLGTKKDTLIYDLLRDNPQFAPFFLKGFSEFSWSPDYKFMGLILFYYTISASDLFVYSRDKKNIFSCSGSSFANPGRKSSLLWRITKSLIYNSSTNQKTYEWLIADSITSVKNSYQTISKELHLDQNYPNPFNNSTVIL
jgi:hypothetical protein